MKRLLHLLSHLFGTNEGEAVTWWEIDALMCGFKCHGCGEVIGGHRIGVYTYAEGTERRFKWLIKG